MDKKAILVIELLQVAEILFGRIKEQDENLRKGMNYEHENGVVIYSGSFPELQGDSCGRGTTLAIRGSDRKQDFRTFLYRFKDEKTATKVAEKIKKAVEDFNIDPYNVPVAPTEALKCKKIM